MTGVGSIRTKAVSMSMFPHHDHSSRSGVLSARRREAQSTADVLLRGLLAGATGVAAMTLAEKLEQTITKRPNSYVPAHTLERLLRLPVRPDSERLGLNWAMHWGQGIALGTVRALMAQRGVRGPVASFIFLNLRLANDQTLENATGVGAPPWTWPVDEQVIDLLHKAIYAFATGAVADHLVEHAGSNGEQVGFRHHPDDWRDSESRKERAATLEPS